MQTDDQENNSLEIETSDSSSLESPVVTPPASTDSSAAPAVKKPSRVRGVRRIVDKINIYLLIFILLIALTGAVVAAAYYTSRPQKAVVQNQSLDKNTLKQLANNDVTLGQPKQVLSVQSNAVFAGKVLVRDSLEVAGPIQVGGALNIPGITVTGNSVFNDMRINKSLSVGGDTTLQGQLNTQKNLNVSGNANVGGSLSADRLSANSLQMNGNLTITKHFSVGGATPARSNGNALGAGGTASVSGSDTAGSVNVNTGSGASAGCFATINFTQRFNGVPRVIVSPVGEAAGRVGMYVNRNNTSFSVCASQTPPSGASFGFDYFVIDTN